MCNANACRTTTRNIDRFLYETFDDVSYVPASSKHPPRVLAGSFKVSRSKCILCNTMNKDNQIIGILPQFITVHHPLIPTTMFYLDQANLVLSYVNKFIIRKKIFLRNELSRRITLLNIYHKIGLIWVYPKWKMPSIPKTYIFLLKDVCSMSLNAW